jgi:nucleoside-diphosphate-sugar epimerase
VTEESVAEPARETGRILCETEEFVVTRGGIVARLAGIYGPGRSALLRKFLVGNAVLDPASSRFVNQAHRDDIAAALLLLVQQRRGGEIYNVSDHHPISQRECYEWLAVHLQRPLPPIVAAVAERKRGATNKRVSSEKLQAIGWRPRYPTFADGMLRSVLPAEGL